jgi:serine/threonine protein kinase
MAPELWGGHGSYGIETDLWALGCMLFEMTTLKHPFGRAQTANELKTIVTHVRGTVPELLGIAGIVDMESLFDPGADTRATELLSTSAALLARDPFSRPTCSQLARGVAP